MTNVILFRAQPFHNGHLHMIKRALMDAKREGNKLFVFVGSADKSGTKRNPLPIDLRLDLIKGSLKDEIETSFAFNPETNIIPLDDLSDEANNSTSWGTYLYDKITEIVKDEFLTFYYSDKPEIILSWFDDYHRDFISFKFIARYKGVTATMVREYIVEDPEDLLWLKVPKYIYNNREIIKKYLMEAK